MEKMTFFEAALKTLDEASGGPLHYRDIAKTAMAKGYIQTEGKTPEATFFARMHQHIKQAEKLGEEPKVRAIGNGLFSLSRKHKSELARHIDAHNATVRGGRCITELDKRKDTSG